MASLAIPQLTTKSGNERFKLSGPPRKPASKLPHLRKQMQKNQITKGLIQKKIGHQKPKEKK